ncbi:YhiS [Escherichia coli]
MSIDFTPGIINTYHGDIYNCTTNTDNAKTPDTPKWPCDNWEEQHPLIPHSLEKDISLINMI